MQPPDENNGGASGRSAGAPQSALSMASLVARPSAHAAEFVPSYALSNSNAGAGTNANERATSEQAQLSVQLGLSLQQQQKQRTHFGQQIRQQPQHNAQYQHHGRGGTRHAHSTHRGGRFGGQGGLGGVVVGGSTGGANVAGGGATAAAAAAAVAVAAGGHRSQYHATHAHQGQYHGTSGSHGPHDIYANHQLRENARLDMAMLLRSAANTPGVPESVLQYYNLLPLEASASPLFPAVSHPISMAAPAMSIVYKAVSSKSGQSVALRRVLGPSPANSAQIVRAADVWKRLSHPGIVRLQEAFTTRAFSASSGSVGLASNEVILSYDFCPRADTLQNVFLASGHQYHPLGEPTMWAIATQLLAATAAVHAAGLALRDSLSPSCILVTGRNRVRVNRVGMSDIFDRDGIDHIPMGSHGASVGSGGPGALGVTAGITGNGVNSGNAGPGVVANGARIVALQKEDLAALGRILLVLATRSQMSQVRAGVLISAPGVALDALQHSGAYTADFVQVVAVLLAAASPTSRTVIRDVLSMIGPRLAVEMANVWTHADLVEGQLAKECEASRLFRLSTLLGFVNERHDPSSNDAQWAETGDRYLLKLFRDYAFHRSDESGRPLLDFAHVIECLNRLDIGSSERVLLSSRDGVSLIAASYEDIRRCLMQAVDELRQQGGNSSLASIS